MKKVKSNRAKALRISKKVSNKKFSYTNMIKREKVNQLWNWVTLENVIFKDQI